jgi:predicted DsbA family dithiol-disulfide isomerase
MAVRRFLDSSEGSDELAADLHEAYDNGITAVPTFVINGRFSIPGAQESETFVRALTRMADVLRKQTKESRAAIDTTEAALGACEGDVCDR